MTASFLLISLQTQSFVLAGPYTVCAPLHHCLPLYPSLAFSLWLPSFLPFQLLLHTLNSTFSLCYHSWTFLPLPLSFRSLYITFFFSILLHLDLLYFSPSVLCFFFNFSFSLLLLSLSSFLSFPLSFLFLFVLLPFVLQCISHSTSFCEQLKFIVLHVHHFLPLQRIPRWKKFSPSQLWGKHGVKYNYFCGVDLQHMTVFI